MNRMDESTDASPHCQRCRAALQDWLGNVMVPQRDMSTRRITRLEVWCKPCTIAADGTGYGERWHNFLELSWVRDRPLRYATLFFVDAATGERTWTEEAAEAFAALLMLARPEEMSSAMHAALLEAEAEAQGI